MSKLSAVQEKALDLARRGDGVLVRWRGGFWTYPGCPVSHESWPSGAKVPTEYVTAGTIYALQGRQILAEEERDSFGGYSTKMRLTEGSRS